jgi:hypothetical protein
VVPEAPTGEWVSHFDIEVIRTPEEAMQHLPKNAQRCAILGEAQSALGKYAAFKPNNPQPVLDYLDYHRAYKTPYEIAMLRQATRRGVRAHRAAERAFRAGRQRVRHPHGLLPGRGPGCDRTAVQRTSSRSAPTARCCTTPNCRTASGRRPPAAS